MPGPRTLVRAALELARLPHRLASLERRLDLLQDAPPRRRATLGGDPRHHGPLDLFDQATSR